MAIEQNTLLTEGSSKEGCGQGFRVKIAIALTVALVSPLANSSHQAQAADFRHAKKIVVPASSIPRRYDYDSAGGRESGLPAGYESSQGAGYASSYPNFDTGSTSSTYSPKAGKSGLVPPPPPVTPSLLPSSMAGDIPPPPTAPPIVSRSGSVAPNSFASSTTNHSAHGASGSVSSSSHQQISGDPTRASGLDRHQYSSKTNKLGSENSTVSYVVSRADLLAKEGKLQESQELLEKYEKTYPNNSTLDHKLSQVSLERAKYYMRHDDYVEGAKQARIALAHNSSNTEAKHALEQILRHHGVDPHHSLSRVKTGDVLFSQGKLKEARVEYDAALKVDHSTQAYIGLGNISLREHKLKEAKSHYQMALEKEPESSVALRQMGIVRYKLKDVVGANTDLSRALVLNQDDKLAGQTLTELWQRQVSMRPKDANSHLGLARAYQLSGDLKSAQNSYRTVVSIDPNHPNLPAARQSFKLALARQEAQKTYEAAKTLDASGAVPEAYNKAAESVSLSPGDVKFRLYQAELAERLGNFPEAKHLYLEILRQDSKNTVAAAKIKSLSELLTSNDTAQSLRGPIGPGLQAQAGALDVAAQSLLGQQNALQAAPQSLSQGALSSALGTPGFREGPALPTLPAAPGATPPMPSGDHIQNMSGFLGDLRGFMFKQKKDLQKQEDTILENIGAKPKSESSSSKIADLPPLPNVPDLPKNLISSSDVQKLLAGAGTSTGAGSVATGAALGAGAAAAAGALSAPGAQSAGDIAKLLGGGSAGIAPPSTSQLSGSLPPIDINSLAGKLPPGVSAQNVASMLGGMSGSGMASPPFSTGADSQRLPGDDSILSSPRRSETVLKVAEPEEEMPPVAPPRVGAPSFASAPQSFSSPPAGFNAVPQAMGSEAEGLAAQAQSLSPQALSGIARSLGMDPAVMSSMASQAIQQAPQLINAAPQLYNKGIANLKQEDIDKFAKMFKDHVAAKQQAMGITPKPPVKGKEIVTTKATPQVVKKVAVAKADPKAVKTAAAKPAAKTASAKTPSKTAIASKPTASTKAPVSTPAASVAPPVTPASLPAQNIPSAVEALPVAEAAVAENLVSTPSAPPINTERMDSLEAQNKDLANQLESTKRELQELREALLNKGKGAKPIKKVKTTKTVSKPSEPSTMTQPVQESSAPSFSMPPTSGFAPAGMTSPGEGLLPPASGFTPVATSFAQNSVVAGAQAIGNISGYAPSSIVNLELAGVNVKSRGVRLNVVLRNGTNQEVNLPSTTKAVVRMVGAPDQLADVKFPVRSLTPGQEAKGYITVSGHKLDPSADVFIPKLMSSETGAKDVHLTVPISALSKIPQ